MDLKCWVEDGRYVFVLYFIEIYLEKKAKKRKTETTLTPEMLSL